MKNKKLFLTTTVACLFVAATTVTIYSCKKDVMEGVDLITDVNFTKATIGVQFVDAKTGDNIGFGSATPAVTATLSGAGAANVVDITGGNNFTTAEGFLVMAVKKGVTPSAGSPVDFTISAKSAGYLSTTQNVSINVEGGVDVVVSMVKITDAPDGVAFTTDNQLTSTVMGTTATGTTLPISVATTASTSGADMTIAKMDIPVGEKFYSDAAKTQRITDPIGTTFGHFSGTEEASLMAMPGGLEPKLSNGTKGQFKMAGLVSVEMKGTTSGKTVVGLGTAIPVTMGIPTGMKIEDESRDVVAGDAIPYYSHDAVTDTWTQEGTGTVMQGTNGLEVTMNVTHFSTWTTGYFQTDQCTVSYQIAANSSLYSGANPLCMKIYKMNLTTGSRTLKYHGHHMISQICSAYWTILDHGNSNTLEIDVYGSHNLYHSPTDILFHGTATCGTSGNVTVNPTNPAVTVSLSATCASKPGIQFRPTTPCYVRKVGTSQWFLAANMVNGNASTTSLKQGVAYDFGTMFDGKFIKATTITTVVNGTSVNNSAPFTISGTTFTVKQELPSSSCSKIH
jgi:hypothetical protein